MERLRQTFALHPELLARLGLFSIGLFVVALVVFPIIVIYLPEDYFGREQRVAVATARRHPLLWLTATLLKNLLGIALIVAGFAMLILPGQGLLSILLGVSLTNFPGKFALERRLVRRPAVHGSLNGIRRWAKKPDFVIPDD